jgi:hypothetical protein
MRKPTILGACLVVSLLLGEGLAEAQGCGNLAGNYAFRLVSLKSFSADTNAGLETNGAPYQDILRVGVLTIRRDCTLAASVRATIDNNQGATRLVLFRWMGRAFPEGGRLGELRVRPAGEQICRDSTLYTFQGGKPETLCPADIEGAEEYEYVITREGLELIQSDNAGGGAKIFMTGQAHRDVQANRSNDDDDDDD